MIATPDAVGGEMQEVAAESKPSTSMFAAIFQAFLACPEPALDRPHSRTARHGLYKIEQLAFLVSLRNCMR